MFLEVLGKKRDKKVFAGRTEKKAVCQKNNQSLSIEIKHAWLKWLVADFRKQSLLLGQKRGKAIFCVED
jgi:hypothetical protein